MAGANSTAIEPIFLLFAAASGAASGTLSSSLFASIVNIAQQNNNVDHNNDNNHGSGVRFANSPRSHEHFVVDTGIGEGGSGADWRSPYHPITQIMGWIVASLLSLETIVGNAMVIAAYKLERSISKQVSNRFIVSLAISDLIIGIEGIPLFTVYVINGDRWPLGKMACETWLFLDYTLCLVSILTVLLITVDRYLSVCHTAEYLKWQNPVKIQLLIVFSWIIPAAIFGVMIYGWPWLAAGDDADESGAADSSSALRSARLKEVIISGRKGADGSVSRRITFVQRKCVWFERTNSDGECFAPFLSNPYVNMSMYVAYYWTTLIAMLILYKGIHKAAKKLEKKAKAKEHRHIALLLTQRLGTQVGVSLMLQSKKREMEMMKNEVKDSGYVTNTLSTVTGAGTATTVTAPIHPQLDLNAVAESRRGSTLLPELHHQQIKEKQPQQDHEQLHQLLHFPPLPRQLTEEEDSEDDELDVVAKKSIDNNSKQSPNLDASAAAGDAQHRGRSKLLRKRSATYAAGISDTPNTWLSRRLNNLSRFRSWSQSACEAVRQLPLNQRAARRFTFLGSVPSGDRRYRDGIATPIPDVSMKRGASVQAGGCAAGSPEDDDEDVLSIDAFDDDEDGEESSQSGDTPPKRDAELRPRSFDLADKTSRSPISFRIPRNMLILGPPNTPDLDFRTPDLEFRSQQRNHSMAMSVESLNAALNAAQSVSSAAVSSAYDLSRSRNSSSRRQRKCRLMSMRKSTASLDAAPKRAHRPKSIALTVCPNSASCAATPTIAFLSPTMSSGDKSANVVAAKCEHLQSVPFISTNLPTVTTSRHNASPSSSTVVPECLVLSPDTFAKAPPTSAVAPLYDSKESNNNLRRASTHSKAASIKSKESQRKSRDFDSGLTLSTSNTLAFYESNSNTDTVADTQDAPPASTTTIMKSGLPVTTEIATAKHTVVVDGRCINRKMSHTAGSVAARHAGRNMSWHTVSGRLGAWVSRQSAEWRVRSAHSSATSAQEPTQHDKQEKSAKKMGRVLERSSTTSSNSSTSSTGSTTRQSRARPALFSSRGTKAPKTSFANPTNLLPTRGGGAAAALPASGVAGALQRMAASPLMRPLMNTNNINNNNDTPRKWMNLTRETGDRFVASMFAPITAFNRIRKHTKAEKRAHKAFRTITFIVGLFAILWSPYYVVATIYGFCKGECVPSLLYNVAYYMCYLNSSLNPFAYALANRQFRSAFLRMFHGDFSRIA